MDLSTILTYIGLLISAYGATQEYIRLKLKLAPLKYTILFTVSLFLLYIATLEFVEYELITYGTIHFNSGISLYLWEMKHLILLTINLFSLYIIIKASKLTSRNQKQFLDLIHELRANKNYAMLHKLIKENLEIIFKIKYNKTFEDKAKDYNIKQFQNLIKTDTKERITKLEELKDKIFYKVHNYLGNFSLKKNIINEIFKYTVSDKVIIKSVTELNELLGIEILKNILKYKAFDSEFKNRFLINSFKNRESYVYKEYIIGHTGTIYDFFNDNQQYEQGLDIGLNICFAILELIEDNQEILVENYQDFELKPIFKHIRELFEALENTDPFKSHYSNLPHVIQKVILKNIDLSKEEETVGFYFLNSLFSVMKELNIKCNGCYIESFNSLYFGFIYNARNAYNDNLIRIGCHYIDYMFNDMYIENIENHVQQFKKHIEQTYSSEKEVLFQMYLMVLDKRRERGDCEDYIAYTHANIDSKITKYWDEIENLLNSKVQDIQ